MKQAIYLDHNATTPVFPEVREAMEPFWGEFYANPSSLHEAGARVARALREARRDVARFLGAQDETEIIFTSGGTESNNFAFRSALFTSGKKQVVTTAIEHSSVLKLTRALREEGVEADYLPVDGLGRLVREKIKETVSGKTALVSVMAANNETGVIFPVEEIGKELEEKGVLFHVDAVQAVGKIPLVLKDSPIHFLSLSAHKFGGPKGVGALYVKKGTPLRSFIFGGAQERGRRAGTENVPGIIGLAAACRRLEKVLGEETERVRQVRDYFEKKTLRTIPGAQINGDPLCRLPNTSNLAFEGVDSEALLILLDQEGVYASSGSACLSGSPEPSHVLKAMGFPDERAQGTVRFSFGPENTVEEADRAVEFLQIFISRLREIELQDQHPHSVI